MKLKQKTTKDYPWLNQNETKPKRKEKDKVKENDKDNVKEKINNN